MDTKLFDELEGRVASLLAGYNSLKQENKLLKEENTRFLEERDIFKARIDLVLKKLEGIQLN